MSNLPEAVIRSLSPLPRVSHSVTIGNFDGVHRGHQYLISLVVERARIRSHRSLVITFEPHPTTVLRPDVPFERLTTPEAKLRLLRASLADDIIVIPFDLEFAALSPNEFLEIISDAACPESVYVGEGFRFGHRRAGDGETIRAFGATRGFETVVIPRLRDNEHIISSSTIREALHAGNLSRAEAALGRRYRLRGTVEHGVARGRELGFPTANLHMPVYSCIPMDGIYAAWAHLDIAEFAARAAMVYIGSRPTFDNGKRLVEVNILDFNGDLYAHDVEIEFAAFIRGDVAFESADALVRQMQRDEEQTRATLARIGPEPR